MSSPPLLPPAVRVVMVLNKSVFYMFSFLFLFDLTYCPAPSPLSPPHHPATPAVRVVMVPRLWTKAERAAQPFQRDFRPPPAPCLGQFVVCFPPISTPSNMSFISISICFASRAKIRKMRKKQKCRIRLKNEAAEKKHELKEERASASMIQFKSYLQFFNDVYHIYPQEYISLFNKAFSSYKFQGSTANQIKP